MGSEKFGDLLIVFRVDFPDKLAELSAKERKTLNHALSKVSKNEKLSRPSTVEKVTIFEVDPRKKPI